MQFSASQIAPLISGVIEGDASILVSNFGKIESAQPGDLAFLANPKYESFAYTTKASILLVANTFAPNAACCLDTHPSRGSPTLP